MNKDSKILILGARGLVGSSLVRTFKSKGYKNILSPFREEVDLLKQNAVVSYFEKNRPEYVIDAAAKVGGIHANNTYKADFIFQNLSIQNNVFEACFITNVKKFLFLGSSCIYPKNCPQPIKEEYLLTGPLEPTNDAYAIAKIAGLKMAESFKKQYGLHYYSLMPTNLYGINDNFHPENSHVIPGLIVRMKKTLDENKETFEIWGTGKPMREFLYVDDLAEACHYVMSFEDELPDSFLNVGTGEDISIGELVKLIGKIMGFKGEYVFNSNYPDGTLKKLLDVSKIKALGWKPQVSLEEGLKRTIQFYLGGL